MVSPLDTTAEVPMLAFWRKARLSALVIARRRRIVIKAMPLSSLIRVLDRDLSATWGEVEKRTLVAFGAARGG
ncbi:MAG: hypothetical protein ABII06_21420 [Pseudomonadota bacterium]